MTTELKREDFAPAPARTQWGAGMLQAFIAIGKDAIADIYVHEDDLEALLKQWAEKKP